MSNIKERLEEFLKVENLTHSSFEKKCQLGNGFCNKVSDNITTSTLITIKHFFPKLNIEWLVKGEGEMYLNSIENITSSEDIISLLKEMMEKIIRISDVNSQVNLINAETYRINARNFERIIDILENKINE